MSVQTFIANPLVYAKSHIIAFDPRKNPANVAAAAGMQVTQTYSNWGGAWEAKRFAMVPGQFTDFSFDGDTDPGTGAHVRIGRSGMHWIQCKTSAVDKGIRFLPWDQNLVTFMHLDAGATTFFTGPLSGCVIVVGVDGGGSYWTFHANRNNQPGADNTALKTNMLLNTIAAANLAGVRVLHTCAPGINYHDLAFVFGQILNGRWRFHVVDSAVRAGSFSTRVVELP